MEEPAGVPSARCKTSLASAYGLMSEVSPAFTLPASPLVQSLLDDTNLALAKFLEDQTVHGFLPVPWSPSSKVLPHLLFLFSWAVHSPTWHYLDHPRESW